MKMVRDTTGRFSQRPHYEATELDRECEIVVSSFLKTKYGSATFPLSTDDLTLLVESESEELDVYADLSCYGPGVEGVTLFVPGAKPRVKTSRELAENSSLANRFRTTLSHEFGHVHFHSYLFDASLQSLDLFVPASGSRTAPAGEQIQICKRDTMVDAAQADWMEWQAGHVCGAILMPASFVRQFLRARHEDDMAASSMKVSSVVGGRMIEDVATHFEVSREAARVRLLRLKVLNEATTSSLI